MSCRTELCMSFPSTRSAKWVWSRARAVRPRPSQARDERFNKKRSGTDRPSAPENAHQQWGESPHRTEHWLSVVEGNCVVERRGGEQPEANCQSINNTMANTIRPEALASPLGKGEVQNPHPPPHRPTTLLRPPL